MLWCTWSYHASLVGFDFAVAAPIDKMCGPIANELYLALLPLWIADWPGTPRCVVRTAMPNALLGPACEQHSFYHCMTGCLDPLAPPKA